ncbi:PhzF family phenazine biosynthesis protein [Pantoea eucalypti]|uniref:PhzF family phenazine biosynthesis protein n=1 Tax=Pantoea eucalypti TaxID=470933 RepID=UPI0024BB744E|nr:PhzF family phenazine biosynthesis protein [Pantoea eucalypti]MDJ0474307.1 PhzF family phenazine biosynthesis protein [Pantoea eucalypti]
MDIHHIAAFSYGSTGGNPAGVGVCDRLPDAVFMQKMASELGYSETVFAAPEETGWRVRYFAPAMEVDFCGHATIALGAVLARQYGDGDFALRLNQADITVKGYYTSREWSAAFMSPPTRSKHVTSRALQDALRLFGLSHDKLDPNIPPAVAHGGGDHLILALRDRETLNAMAYDMAKGEELTRREGYLTFSLIFAKNSRYFHVRNPFPAGGVYEDPATGAAAAALAGYLRDISWPHGGSVEISQGEDMGVPSRLLVSMSPEVGSSIQVAGTVRRLR